MRIVWSLICVLCCLFLFSGAALGDTDIYHIPTKEQLSEAEALKVATAFWLELCSVDISEEIDAGNYTALFGPGYQWGANTEDDCWTISIPMGADLPIRPSIIIHGTTGDVVHWQFRDKETKITYICMLPDETHISLEAAITIAKKCFQRDAHLEESDLTEMFVSKSFGVAQYYIGLKDRGCDDYPIWNIFLASSESSFPEMGDYYISAIDGSVLEVEITLDSEIE